MPEHAQRVEDERVAVHHEALLGGLDFSPNTSGFPSDHGAHVCSQDERHGATQVAILARTIVRSQAFADCVDLVASGTVALDGVNMGPYMRCSRDPSGANASTMIAAARNARPVKLVCLGDDSGGLTPASNGTGTHDYIGLGMPEASTILATDEFGERWGKLAEAANYYVHEVLHTWGFYDSGSCPSFRNNGTHIVGECVQAVATRSLNRCNVQSCASAGELNLIDRFATGALASSVGCTCVRDHAGPVQTAVPSSPRLGTNDTDDNYGSSTATGDFDGDGFQDLAVGAPYDAGEALGANSPLPFFRSTPAWQTIRDPPGSSAAVSSRSTV